MKFDRFIDRQDSLETDKRGHCNGSIRSSLSFMEKAYREVYAH